jgi:hypothetical protein
MLDYLSRIAIAFQHDSSALAQLATGTAFLTISRLQSVVCRQTQFQKLYLHPLITFLLLP